MRLIYSEDVGLIYDSFDNKHHFEKLELTENFDSIYLSINQFSLFDLDDNTKTYFIYDINKQFTSKPSQQLINFLEDIKATNQDVCFYVISKDINKAYEKFFDIKNIVNIKKLNRATIKTYIKNYLKKVNYPINFDLFEYLCQKLPLNSLMIKNEIDKLSLFPIDKLSKKVLDELISTDISDNVFELLNAFFAKDTNKIIQYLNYFSNSKMDYHELFNIIVSQMFNLKLYIKHYQFYKSFDKLLSDFKLQRFQIDKQIGLIQSAQPNCIDKFLKSLLKLNLYFMLNKKDLELELKLLLINGDEYGI